jgi:hypothetical protein
LGGFLQIRASEEKQKVNLNCKLSNLLEDLLKLDWFAESVYDDLSKDGNPELE